MKKACKGISGNFKITNATAQTYRKGLPFDPMQFYQYIHCRSYSFCVTIQIAHQKKKKSSLESQIVLSLPTFCHLLPWRSSSPACCLWKWPKPDGNGGISSGAGMAGEALWRGRSTLEQAAEGCLRFHFQWNIWLLCQSIAHAVGLGEQGISQTSQKSYTNFPLS